MSTKLEKEKENKIVHYVRTYPISELFMISILLKEVNFTTTFIRILKQCSLFTIVESA